MFSACYKCTKLITVVNLLNKNSRRLISIKKEPHVNYRINNVLLQKNWHRKGYSSTSNSDTVENDGTNEEIDYKAIVQGDEELEHKLKVIALEAEVMRQEGRSVPANSYLTQDHWKELLNLPSRTARNKYLEYLFKISKKKEHRETKKLEKRVQREEFMKSKEELPETEETIEEFASQYDLKHNNLFLRFYETTMNQMYNNRLIQAIMFGQKLVVDCGYADDMSKRENLNCAKQLMLLFAENRAHDEPFDLHFCNSYPESLLIKQLNKYIPNMYDASFPLNIHEESYLDKFPKEQLVYLTPHCREEMSEYDHDAIYIVGAIVDKINNQPLSLAKAKKEGLKMAKLPLDKYLQWGSGSGKSLTLNQVVSILNDVKSTKNWERALRHVPRRKIVDYSIGKNITNAANNTLRYDRQKERKWAPTANVNFDLLKYNKRKTKEKEPIVKIKSLLSD